MIKEIFIIKLRILNRKFNIDFFCFIFYSYCFNHILIVLIIYLNAG